VSQPIVVQACSTQIEFQRNTIRILGGFTLALILGTLLQAQAAITGKWQGTTRNGLEVLLDLKATDAELTGTLTRDGRSSTITEGKVSKNTFTFKAILGDQTETLTGELGGEQLKVWLDRQGPEGAVVFKRLKE
jgi:hypothetical protein